ncbi:MAG: glycine C-acetyltransferase [Oligoflexia bacterium]|nr:glycine C-acetyltransferase [Oligoflexia bacterium]
MFDNAKNSYATELEAIKQAGLYKRERVIESPQSPWITVNGKQVLNLCANNYLGLSNSDVLKDAAKKGIDQFGLGLSSVRFICGTQSIHKKLEQKISEFFKTEDAILYTSCFDANGGLFETILGEQDAIISDALNHASIIDGIRLCKAKRFRYEHNNLAELETHLKAAKAENCPRIMIATDAVFSMDGDIGLLPQICDLAERYGAMVMVDESHATGFFGPTGRGVIEALGVMHRVDVITSTLGKALGGSAGGFTTGRREIIGLLRQRSRPYLFSNSLPPALVTACIACLDMLSKSTALRDKLEENTKYFRKRISDIGLSVRPGTHPIVPIMLGEAKLAVDFADALLNEGIYVIGFSYPVVPKGQARIRVQISAAHSKEDLDKAIEAFARVGKRLGICQ